MPRRIFFAWRDTLLPEVIAMKKQEKPIPPEIYTVIDTDLARDNLENDIPQADLADLQGQ